MWIGGVLGVLFLVIVALILFTVSRLSSKVYHPHAESDPRFSENPVVPILQLEDHTCGLLSLSAAYTRFGLSPSEENLRYRLGVDRPANPIDETTTGTLHPDIFRVLSQDHLEYTIVDPAESDIEAILRRRFTKGDLVLFLIARRENGHLHWVMSDGFDGSDLRIVDSLRESAYAEPPESFLRDLVLSIVAIRPAAETSTFDPNPHADGIKELFRVNERIARRRNGSSPSNIP